MNQCPFCGCNHVKVYSGKGRIVLGKCIRWACPDCGATNQTGKTPEPLAKELPIEQVEKELADAGITGISFKQAGKMFKQIADLTRERDEARAEAAVCLRLCREIHNEPIDLAGQAQALLDELQYLREHHDECHQPAANYELLLDRLNGVLTNHGDCRVAAKLDEQEAELARLRRLETAVEDDDLADEAAVGHEWDKRADAIGTYRVALREAAGKESE